MQGDSVAHISHYADLPTFASYTFNSKWNALNLPRKSRVVSIYEQCKGKPIVTTNSNVSKASKFAYFCSGTILEEPSMENAFRYLVAYDQGAMAYCKPANVYPCMDLFGMPENRLHADHVHFLRTQLVCENIHHLNINMANSHERDQHRVYFCGKWRKAHLIDTDCSLMRVRLKVDFELDLGHDDQVLSTSRLGNAKYTIL